jgi:hypothetical protein
MRAHWLLICLGLAVAAVTGRVMAADAPDKPSVIVVVGAAGEPEYGSNFLEWSDLWVTAARKGGAAITVIGTGPTNGPADVDLIQQQLAAQPKESANELWVVLLGHGTYDGKTAKFNLRGPDFTPDDLAGWLKPFKRPLAIVDCSSSSGPFLPKLSAPGRVIITATRSGDERNFARFGQYISEAIADPAADLDKDGQTSLLEAFLMASHRVAEFYKDSNRLMTEHALIDDNGDGKGTPADWFKGVRAVKKPAGGQVDGMRAQQFVLVRSAQEQQLASTIRSRRDELELAVGKLRDQKDKMSEDDYYGQLEPMLEELARISAQKTP